MRGTRGDDGRVDAQNSLAEGNPTLGRPLGCSRD
jgi:hypothetical protein